MDPVIEQIRNIDITHQIHQGGNAWWELRGNIAPEQLREGLRPAVENYLRHKVLLRAIAETSAYDPNVRSAYGELMSHSIDQLTELIAERQRQRRISRRVDAPRTAAWLIWMFERGLYQLAGHATDPGDVEAWLDSVTNIVWHTLYSSDA